MISHRRSLRALALALSLAAWALHGLAADPKPAPAGGDRKAAALAAFETVRQVLQHPRCQNCHIPGDAPLQFDSGLPHAQGVLRGSAGRGAPGLPCATCHGRANPPSSFGPHVPPGAPHWQLPAPGHKMVFLGLSSGELCAALKDKNGNGGRDFAKLIEHVSKDGVVLWGWNPGGLRAPVPVPHAEFVAKFKEWAAAGGPCPQPVAGTR